MDNLQENRDAFTAAIDVCREIGFAKFAINLANDGIAQDELKQLVEAVGMPSLRDGGLPVWPVVPRGEVGTFSVRTGMAEMHTDSQYHDEPEPYVLLYVDKPARVGGDTLVLHMDDMLDELSSNAMSGPHFSELSRPIWRWRKPDVFGGEISGRHPVISSVGIRWRSDNIVVDSECDVSPELVYAVSSVVARAPAVRQLKMDCGVAVLLDNRRVLHGRTDFSDTARRLFRTRFWGFFDD